jgi:hypothetical protein
MKNKILLLALACLFVTALWSFAKRPTVTADLPLLSPLASPVTKTVTIEVELYTRPQTDEEMIKSLEWGEVVWATYGHESTYGKHDSCKAKGMYNGFGYGQKADGSVPCYSSLEEIATEVSKWFTKKLDKYTIRQALCLYNTGTASNDCGYASYTMQMMGGSK